ncbi:tetratricopeptide repeat-containing sulfotransferase family protein [Rhizomicrobium electricum]|uniref:Tetratricopeptide repeat-containing sulfotransferase family protein n=1 Tax=Rhizomicrobium electricum TaxID=480070 RepID=A0ABP3PFL6_9PROT|nr:sulfotransferase [Rhizomicrobium electricum]NIJ48462.1 tetratricopeptide (TPR) repeat protein [Rhizomicrobium electricum]
MCSQSHTSSDAAYQAAVALHMQGRTAEAEAAYLGVLNTHPDHGNALHGLSVLYVQTGRTEAAVGCLRRAVAATPNDPVLWCGLGEVLGALQGHDEAAQCFARATQLAPDFALAHFNRGTALFYLGCAAEAADAFSRAVALEPQDPAFRRALLGIEKVQPGNVHLKALEAMAQDGLSPSERIALHFALAKAYDDLGDYARAFAELARGNAEKRRFSRYSIATDLARFEAIAATFSADFLSSHAGLGTSSDVPVFVIGMPRSGTSLVEQILASHPDVFGAGERDILPSFINAGRVGREFPAGVGALEDSAWTRLGEDYVRTLRALAPDVARITDKLPLNFHLVGLIRIAMPNARIVHVRRDPLDTCFSCFSTLFDDDLDFSCDLADLARYYHGYHRLMDHWRAVLPAGVMLEVQYERLVADIDAEARRLIDFCGLDWNERCLKFYETRRPVQTASALQVRQPLYTSSVGRAARYAPWLEPLRRRLEAQEGT